MEKSIRAEIRRFVFESPENRFPGKTEPYFDEPLIGFASATDPLFVDYKRIIGEFHQSPGEIMTATLGNDVNAATVICWVLPITDATRKSNRLEASFPSRQWAETRSFGEQFNVSLRRHMVTFLTGRGHHAVAPQLSPVWKEFSESPVGVASNWSERHAAYAAGLGTFSLNDALITPKGIAHRLGSVITDLTIQPSPHPYADYRQNCLYYRENSCGACIGRCPADALSRQGHDKAKCREFVYGTAPKAVAELYGVPNTGCGLCQTGVPCEAMVPKGSIQGS